MFSVFCFLPNVGWMAGYEKPTTHEVLAMPDGLEP